MNRSRVGKNNSMFGKKHSKESLEKMRNAQLGKKASEETKLKMSDSNKRAFLRKHHSIKTRKKWSLLRKGTRLGKDNFFYGKRHSKETKKIMCGRIVTNETKLKLRNAHLGKKHSEETKAKLRKSAHRGSDHFAWQGGGLLFKNYNGKFTAFLKEQIRKRDNYICQKCGTYQNDLTEKLSIHHIDYDKKNNKPENLLSLCRSCHVSTNVKRAFWTGYLIGLMKRKNLYG